MKVRGTLNIYKYTYTATEKVRTKSSTDTGQPTIYTVSQKNMQLFLGLTLANADRFSKFFLCLTAINL